MESFWIFEIKRRHDKEGSSEEMIRILQKDRSGTLAWKQGREALENGQSAWSWIDIGEADEDELKVCSRHFPMIGFDEKNQHRYARRPQFKHFDQYDALSLLVLSPNTMKAHVLHCYVSERFLLTVHRDNLKAINDVWHECRTKKNLTASNPERQLMRKLMERLMEQYFMAASHLEDRIDALDLETERESVHRLNQRVFRIRGELLGFRRVISPLEDIVQRQITSTQQGFMDSDPLYLRNIADNLERLIHMIEANMEITSDIRDSSLSLTYYRTNRIMQTLTVITTIFMPLSFIAGVYGMNFRYMPELSWRWGYLTVLIVMLVIAVTMYYWFKKSGWFGK